MLIKNSILLLALAIFLLNGQTQAATVNQQMAQTIATNFYKVTAPLAASSPALTLSLSYTHTEADGSTDYYVFNTAPMNGFVIIAADDNATPVLGYSTESAFNPNIPAYVGISDWVKNAGTRIHYIISHNIAADARIQNLWKAYALGQNPQTNRAGAVGPLLTTSWNQNPYYNALCPPAATVSSSTTKAVTGCVATAMAQVMKYWNYPAQGTGSHSYSDNQPNYSQNYGTLTADFTRPLYWSAMPNAVSSAISPVDTLMYELGVAVNMDYDPAGSGAYVLTTEAGGGPCSQTVYVNNFHYNPGTIQGVHLSSYTDGNWISVMESEINAGRVVQYEGDDATAGGHTWVMDGYSPSTTASGGAMLHMNWGWGGYYNGNFDVTNLSTPGFNPVQNDAALIGIEPIAPYSLTLTPSSPSICPGSSTNLSVHGPSSATYSWTPATGLSCSTCTATSASPTATTLYTVRADSAGVVVTSSIAVTVTPAVTAAFNFNIATSCSLPQNVAFTNTSANATGYTWDFGDGTTGTAATPLHSYTVSGSYTVKLYANNSCGADSLIKSQAVQITGGTPTAPSQSICYGQTATINATGGNIYWYSDAQATNLMQTGNTYITAPLSSTITYYIGSSISPSAVSAGPVSDAIGASSNYTATGIHGMVFNSTTAQTLNSVVVYATGAGDRLFILEDSVGNVLDSATITLANGQQTVQLAFPIPVATSLLLAISGSPNLFRNSAGAVFPYNSTDGTISITGNNLNAAGRFYFFYDWQLQQSACTTPLSPVTVYVLNAGGGAFTVSGTGTTTVSFSPADTSATTYAWTFGDGAISTQVNPVHSYTSPGFYTVQLIISNGSCTDTITQSVNTSVLGVNDITGFSTLAVWPNPAKDVLTLSANSSKQYGDCLLNINNVLGQNQYKSNISLSSGTNKLNIDISNLSAGIYFISLQNGKEVVTTKFVKD
jgi:PKD repeat protein